MPAGNVYYLGLSAGSAGDVDGDGLDDVLVGGSNGDESGGQVMLLRGPVEGLRSTNDADTTWASAVRYTDLGKTPNAVASAGDIDGDGLPDVLIGNSSAGTDSLGAIYVMKGNVTGNVDISTALAVMTGENNYASLGHGVVSPGDLDGDGHVDVVGGATGALGNGTNSGAAMIWYGPVSGAYEMADADARFDGLAPQNGLGRLGALGDIDGDGQPDLVVGEHLGEGDDEDAGVAWVLYGGGR